MRLNDAISMLFQVSDELYTTRQAAWSRINATGMEGNLKPLLLFDNVHDLITVQLLIAAGGKAIFHQLGYHLDHYCAEDASIHAVLGTNTTDVIAEINKLLPHLKPWEQSPHDSTPATMAGVLMQEGFSAADTERLVNTCGTRLTAHTHTHAHGRHPCTINHRP
jgi:hypothetical protein